ncbi:MAG: hypothetical protein JOZ04_08750, partial [Acidimicrobiia bacterium]|nr:hypothetical protein [Acidimicrobiia bacterium]
MRRGLGAAAAAAVVAFAIAMPSASATPSYVNGSISVAMSAGPANPPLLSGDFQTDDPNTAISVTATMSWTGPDPTHHPKYSPQRVCPSAQCTTPSGSAHIAGFPLPAATFNGPYHVDAAAAADNPSPVFGGTANGTAKTDFNVAVPPPNVTGVTAAVDKSRIVTVSWDRDQTTPDVGAYYIYREAPGAKSFTPFEQTFQQNTGARISVTDSTTQNEGGSYLYQVETRRNGGDGSYSTTDFVASDRAKSQSNSVTVPEPPPGTPTITSTTPAAGNGAP